MKRVSTRITKIVKNKIACTTLNPYIIVVFSALWIISSSELFERGSAPIEKIAQKMTLRFSSCDHFHYSASEWLRLVWNALVERYGQLNITNGTSDAQIPTFIIHSGNIWPCKQRLTRISKSDHANTGWEISVLSQNSWHNDKHLGLLSVKLKPHCTLCHSKAWFQKIKTCSCGN